MGVGILIFCLKREIFWLIGFDWKMHYDIKGNLLKKFRCNGRLLNFTAHILRESLVPDTVFHNLDNESRHAPHFFRGAVEHT